MKYDPLSDYLTSSAQENIGLTFTQIENIIGADLPDSARRHRQWWENGGHSQARAWLDTGYKVEAVDFVNERVVFVKGAV